MPPAASAVAPEAAASAPLSLSARKVYEQARSQLLQIRTVLKGRASQTSVGSGFVVSREGHIITNNHVVSDRQGRPVDQIEVQLSDGQTRKARLVGADEQVDLI